MSEHGTPSSNVDIAGWYINLQAAVLKQLPRPHHLDPKVVEGWMQNQRQLKRGLASLLIPGFWSVWQTIPASMFDNDPPLSVVETVLRDAGHDITDVSLQLLHNTKFRYRDEDLDLVCLKVEDLGIESVSDYSKIANTAIALGLELCPEDTAVELRQYYNLQQVGTSIVIGSNPIYLKGEPYLYELTNPKCKTSLSATTCKHTCYFTRLTIFVFARPRRKTGPFD